MSLHRLAVLLVPLLTLAAAAPSVGAYAPECVVAAPTFTCTFPGCPQDVALGAWAYGGAAGATIVVSCSGSPAAASCDAPAGRVCVTRGDSPGGGVGVCTLAGSPDAFGRCGVAGPLAKPVDLCPHASPHAHAYGSGGGADLPTDAITGDRTGARFVTVRDTNAGDCDGDGVGGDFDGDHDSGVGGGFFGYGPWADEPVCNYGLRAHGAVVTVNDVIMGSIVWYVIGADDMNGPVVTVDPVTGETSCATDGAITPGEESVDPYADDDDCLTPPLVGSGTTCGAGGDGGYWVFLLPEPNPPTMGTITA